MTLRERLAARARRDWWKLRARGYDLASTPHRRALCRRPTLPVTPEWHGTGGGAYAVRPGSLDADSVVYSFGIGSNISFDLSLIETYGLRVWGFDPTDEAARFIGGRELPENFRFEQIALGPADEEQELVAIKSGTENYFPGTTMNLTSTRRPTREVTARSLASILRANRHERVDFLKLDIEGAEFAIIESGGLAEAPVAQIALELHPHLANMERSGRMIGRYGWERTRAAIEALEGLGFEIVAISDRGTEFTFWRPL